MANGSENFDTFGHEEGSDILGPEEGGTDILRPE